MDLPGVQEQQFGLAVHGCVAAPLKHDESPREQASVDSGLD